MAEIGKELLGLAHDRSADARYVLASRITDLYAEHEVGLGAPERALVDEILDNLVRAFEIDLRRRLAERLSTRAKVPQALLLFLASDAIEVARPILLRSEALGTEDLVGLILRQGQAHRMAIAQRAVLSEPVSRALVATENVVVIETLLRNPGARFDHATMSHLIGEARWVERFREPLARRPDLSPEFAVQLYALVSATLRKHILEHFDIDPETLDSALADAPDQAHPEAAAAAEPEPPGAPPDPALTDHLASMQEVTPQLLIRVLRRGDTALFEALFGRLSGLHRPRLKRVLYEASGRELAIACRALGLAKAQFAVILFLTRRGESTGGVKDPRDVARLMTYFERLSPTASLERLRRWRRNQPRPAAERGGPGGAGQP